MRETQIEKRRTKEEKKERKKEKRRWKLLISYKRADSLLSPAQHTPDVFDSRYCGAHTHTVKKEGKFTTKKASLCVHGLPTATACCWTRPFSDTATIRFEFYLFIRFFLLKFSEKKKSSFFCFFCFTQVHFSLPIVSRPSAHIFYRRSFAPRIRKLIRRAYIFKLHTLPYLQSSRRALGLVGIRLIFTCLLKGQFSSAHCSQRGIYYFLAAYCRHWCSVYVLILQPDGTEQDRQKHFPPPLFFFSPF